MKPKWRKDLEGRLGEWMIRRIQAKVLRMTPDRAEQKGIAIGRLLYRLGKSRRNRAEANVALAFPDMTQAEQIDVVRRCFEHFGIVSTDFLRTASRSREEMAQTTEVKGIEHLDNAVAAGKGVLLITGHFGNFERLCSWLSTNNYKISVVARDADDRGVQGVLKENRSFTGTRILSRGQAAREILRVLREGEVVGLLPDQNADEIFIPFFGHLAGTVLGPGVLHKRTEAALLPVTCTRIGPCRYRVEAFPCLAPKAGYPIEEGVMRSINEFLEQEVRKAPEQYLWFHDRWRNARNRGLL